MPFGLDWGWIFGREKPSPPGDNIVNVRDLFVICVIFYSSKKYQS